ncbi:hypothetical protein [uncultured Aquimarina sp.]|uniref:hypothetical protein n=1 Tax=uncultured Aquimarina sp. TaxID=575652 RepID=UPI00263A23C2|nr:hypothetical protein [uncultured Aquimarina sp.]
MDELELLKKDWKKQEEGLPKLSYDEIYRMILKKSSSIVKWIFVISILEFILWASIDVIARLSGKYQEAETLGMENFFMISTIISYGVLVYFIVRFYLNYRKIKVTDSAKVLMQNILNTRKTVKYYVWINLTVIGLLIISTTLYMLFFSNELADSLDGKEVPVGLIIVAAIVMAIIFVGFLALIYRLIYGILTRRLKQNYKELQKLEV